jgi:hypothetical protein
MTIPRKMVPDLEEASATALGLISISPAGDALPWPSLDVDVYVPGLVELAFGTRLFARATGQRGGGGVRRRRPLPPGPTARRAGDRASGYLGELA